MDHNSLDAVHAAYAETRDPALRESLIVAYRPLARHFALRYRNTSEPLDDLVQVATAALIAAVDRFDPSCRTRFSTYASRVILGELKRYFRDRTWAVHVPRGLQERYLAVRNAVEELRGPLGRSPTIPELGEHVGISEEDVLEALEVASAYTLRSLDEPVTRNGDDSPVREVATLEDGYARVEHTLGRQVLLDALLDRLDARDRSLVRMYFFDGLSQEQIASRVGSSQVSVSRDLRRILARLRAVADALVAV